MRSRSKSSSVGWLLLLLIFRPGVALAADEKIWAALKEGGKVILLGDADHDIRPGLARLAPGNCAAEINLSPRGRKQAERIGEEFRAHGVMVGEILASPYCRSIDTGRLAFGRATAVQYLMPEAVVSDAQAAANMKRALHKIREYRGPQNLVLVTYGAYVSDIVLEPAENGEFFVLQPKGSTFDVIDKFQVAIPDDAP
jgi:phosphohistidine phosphatase SixA